MNGIAIALFCASCAVARTGASAELLDDPTRPSNVRGAVQSQAPKPRELRLEGILRRNERLIAIIDGRIVHQGERIADATIEEISADTVRYSRGGRDYIARLTRTTLQVRRLSAPQATLP
jgi:hypothetical protein